MNKILSIICLASFLVSGFSAMPVMAEETPEICSETSSQERASWSLSYHNAGVSNYNGSLCVSISTQATEKMEVIGVKDLTVQYSYDGNNWYDEWNAGDFLAYNTDGYELNGCINSANWVQIYNQTGVDPRVVDSNDGDEILVYAAHHGSGSFYSGSVGSEFVAEI